MSRAIRGLYRRYATSGEYTWYIDKCIKRVGRLCESTGTADRDEAERYLSMSPKFPQHAQQVVDICSTEAMGKVHCNRFSVHGPHSALQLTSFARQA